MIGEHYELISQNKNNLFYFISKGNQGEILKAIGFQSVQLRLKDKS